MPDASEAGASGSAGSSNWAFLVDENLPRLLAPLLRSAGYHAEDVRDVGLMTHPDTDVWSYAQTRVCAIVTQDADFADIRAYPPPHAGIVIVDIPDRLPIALKM